MQREKRYHKEEKKEQNQKNRGGILNLGAEKVRDKVFLRARVMKGRKKRRRTDSQSQDVRIARERAMLVDWEGK